MNDFEKLEAAMERAHRHQLGWVFVREYTYHRKRGKTTNEAIAKFEEMWKMPTTEVERPSAKLLGWLGCSHQVA
jgi:hypothetical protein